MCAEVSVRCVCVCACVEENGKKTEGGRAGGEGGGARGLNLYLGVSFRCQGGAGEEC